MYCGIHYAQTLVYCGTVRPRLSGPLLSGSLAIRKKIVGYRFTEYTMHTYSMCVRLSGSLACPDILSKTDVCGYARSDCIHYAQTLVYCGVWSAQKNITMTSRNVLCSILHPTFQAPPEAVFDWSGHTIAFHTVCV